MLQVTVSNDHVLSISGERQRMEEEDTTRTYRVERSFGTFVRSFRMPANADTAGIKAKLDAGVLTLTVPKTDKPDSDAIHVAIE